MAINFSVNTIVLIQATIVALIASTSGSNSGSLSPNGCESFQSWQTMYQKSYATKLAFAKAQSAFETNCKRFAELNTVENGARFIADEYADLTALEFSTMVGGYTEEPSVQSTHLQKTVNEPSQSIDWREKGQVTPVKNQGAFGTCWSFAVAENLEGLNVRQGHALTNISEQEFISCCTTCQGASADHSFKWLLNATDGVPALEASWPYVGKPGDCKLATAPKAPVKLNNFTRVQDDGTGKPIVSALMTSGPMGMGVDATCFQGYHSGVIRNCTSKGIDHAVLMVAAGVDTGVNYFTIKNSWSPKWGEHGYVRIEQGHEWWGPISTIKTV